MYERGDGKMWGASELVQIRDELVSSTKDIARTLDYLRTRRDVDSSRLIYLGYSAGAIFAPPALATYEGLLAAILVSGGSPLESQLPGDFNVHPFQFTPHVKLPVLQISGVFDTSFPLDTSQNPFFADLGSANKKQILLESGHTPPNDEIAKASDKWLNELLASPSAVSSDRNTTDVNRTLR
jgi:predicted esterase